MREVSIDRKPYFKRAHIKALQRGDILLESLVSIVLAGIISLGLAINIAGTIATNAKTNAQAQAVSQLRAMLQKQGSALCNTAAPDITIGKTVISVSAVCTPISNTAITLAGTEVSTNGTGAENKINLRATSDLLGGTIVVGE